MRYSLRQLLIGSLFASLFAGILVWCMRWPQVVITEESITEESEFVLTSEDLDSLEVYTLIFHIFGQIDGQATIELPWNEHGPAYKKVNLGPGPVTKKISNEYYDAKAVIRYKPGNVTAGRLTIRYCFE